MENLEIYEKKLDESAKIRLELNDVYRNKMSELVAMFNYIFPDDKKEIYKLLKDMLYYQGGYPSENTPPKLDILLERFVNVYRFYKFLGIDKIDNYLSSFGINIQYTPIDDGEIEPNKSFQDAWDYLFPNKKILTSKREILKHILDKGMELQSEICKKSDTIKITIAKQIEKECKIKKPHFVKAVNLKYKEIKSKDLNKDLNKIEENINSTINSISVFRT